MSLRKFLELPETQFRLLAGMEEHVCDRIVVGTACINTSEALNIFDKCWRKTGTGVQGWWGERGEERNEMQK